MKKKYLAITAFCVFAGTIAAACYRFYFPDTPLTMLVVGVIPGTLGGMIAFIWDDKRRVEGGENDSN
jgi:hypothetical protein